ncbi:uncharacterized protein LOC130648562, partial [Hydractinia symbiolongicarpus]|uniref:uncharacterized protein LOC130648562 n=1 Tax=Hydractinia symbiolongicarpus TaxID=13093 RepID=UPI002550D52D
LELVEIIINIDIESFYSILINNPNIVAIRNRYKRTLLMEAASYNKPSIVKDLIDAGSDVYAVDEDKWNAYHYSARYGHYDVLKILINHDVTSINNVDDDSNTPLHYAARHDHAECVKLLLSMPGIDVNIRNSENATAFDLDNTISINRLFEEHHFSQYFSKLL